MFDLRLDFFFQNVTLFKLLHYISTRKARRWFIGAAGRKRFCPRSFNTFKFLKTVTSLESLRKPPCLSKNLMSSLLSVVEHTGSPRPGCQVVSAGWFRGRFLLVGRGCHQALSAPLECVFTGPQLHDLPTTQTLVSFVQHSKLRGSNVERG